MVNIFIYKKETLPLGHLGRKYAHQRRWNRAGNGEPCVHAHTQEAYGPVDAAHRTKPTSASLITKFLKNLKRKRAHHIQ